jgi:hypothetical protein
MDEVLPLTPGLLISMAIRMDHGFGADFGGFGFDQRPLIERQRETLDVVFKEYVDAYNGVPIQSQRLEECTGNGFYRPDREESYVTSWGAANQAVEYAKLLVKRFEDMQALTPSRPTKA